MSAIRQNIKNTRNLLKPHVKLLAVVKANAYGHGAVAVAKTALKTGATYLGVATVDEGIELRKADINEPILILSQPPITAIPAVVDFELMPAIYDPEFAIRYAEQADKNGRLAPYHLAVNTGMNRIGVNYFEVINFLSQIDFHRALTLEGVFTHFATADMPNNFDFNKQLDRFNKVINEIKLSGRKPGIVHAANSPATYRYPQSHFDMVRIGISMYGCHPCSQTKSIINLVPAMSIKARITDQRVVTLGEGVGYEMNYRARGAVKICTIPIGYDDGLMRSLSQKICILYKGRRFHQVGNICMDQCMFEIDLNSATTQTKYNAQVGDEVTIVGSDGDNSIAIEELAEIAGTNSYELCCSFSHRLPTKYI